MTAGARTFKGDAQIRQVQLGGTNKLRQERNRAYLAIVLLILCVLSLSAAVTILSSIHTVVPVISIQDANGHVVQQQVVDKETITGYESFIQGQVHDFIVACNTFDPGWRQLYADRCRLRSTPAVARQYDQETSPENRDNPYYALGESGRCYPQITAVTAIDKNAYQVAFKSIVEKAGSQPQTEYYTALVRFSFTFKPLALGDRWENPLGFAAIAYRKDQEFSRR